MSHKTVGVAESHGHSHEHDHDHGGRGWVGRVRHALSEAVGGHSHDAADKLDDVLEADAAGRRALVFSLAGLGLTAAIQAVVVVLSGSVALLGDTLHNVADALTAVPLLVAFALARRPPNRRLTYGYGRAEDLGGVVRGRRDRIVVCFGRLRRYAPIHPETVTHLGVVAAAAVVGFAGNELVARYRVRVGRRIGSAALVADGSACPRRWLYQPCRVAGRRRGRARLAVGRPGRWSAHHGRDPGRAAISLTPGRRSTDGRGR